MGKDGYTLVQYSPCYLTEDTVNFSNETYEYHDGAWIFAHITAQALVRHYMQKFKF